MLDRVMVNEKWKQMFKNAKVYNLEISCSDHFPLWLDPGQEWKGWKASRIFKFENAWIRESRCEEIVGEC